MRKLSDYVSRSGSKAGGESEGGEVKYLRKIVCVVQSPVVMAFLLLFLVVCDAL